MTLEERIVEVKNKMRIAKEKADEYNSMQIALKNILNGSYGAFGNRYFVCSNINIASSITANGRDIIKYMAKTNENYWYNQWHLDTELHILLGVDNVSQINSEYEEVSIGGKISKQRKKPVSVYADTDSCFVSFLPAWESCDFKGSAKEFVLAINRHRIDKVFKDALDDYAKKAGVANIQDFELERISSSIIFLEKKRYVQNVIWEDGIDYEELDYIFPKGVELIKSSTPLFSRVKLLEVLKYILDTKNDIDIYTINRKIKAIKKEYVLADVEDISKNTSCNNYEKFILDDQTDFSYISGTPSHIKAAGYYNFLLNKNSSLKSRYSNIQSGTKIKYYYTNERHADVFAFIRGSHPKEFAPPVDVDKQFETTVLNVINMFVESMGLPVITNQLKFELSLFDF